MNQYQIRAIHNSLKREAYPMYKDGNGKVLTPLVGKKTSDIVFKDGHLFMDKPCYIIERDGRNFKFYRTWVDKGGTETLYLITVNDIIYYWDCSTHSGGPWSAWYSLTECYFGYNEESNWRYKSTKPFTHFDQLHQSFLETKLIQESEVPALQEKLYYHV
jgi:hypothetical protein